jgi:hydroxymethylbilane synthase
MQPLRLGTRGSPLALWQANTVADLLRSVASPRPVELRIIETTGDRDQASALSAMGGFGVFTKAIQDAILRGEADLAVHSLKDLPTIPTEGLLLAATPARGPAGDAFLSKRHPNFDDLPEGARVGTSSLRRGAQILNRRPDLKLVPLRGNVDTRLRKLVDQELDAIVLAHAGLVRLGHDREIVHLLDWMLPAVGQGAIGLECLADDRETRALLEAVNDEPTWNRVTAERAMLATLGGGCLVPIGARSEVKNTTLHLRGIVLTADGKRAISASHRGLDPIALGRELAAILLDAGAGDLLASAA